MYEIMTSDEAIRLIRDGDCICVNSFVGIENPVELHEALYRRYQKMQSPTHLTIVSSAGFGVWDNEHNAEGYIRDGSSRQADLWSFRCYDEHKKACVGGSL